MMPAAVWAGHMQDGLSRAGPAARVAAQALLESAAVSPEAPYPAMAIFPAAGRARPAA
mgnify:CR=1 FL=1